MGKTSENNPCNKCAYLIGVFGKEEMCCMLNKEFSKECFTTEYEKYMKDSKAIKVDKWITLYVNGKKEKALIKEVRYIPREVDTDGFDDESAKKRYIRLHNKRDVRYDIEINGESVLYYFAVGKGLYLQGKRNNDWYGDTILIDITNDGYLLDLLWEIAEYTGYGLLGCYAPSGQLG